MTKITSSTGRARRSHRAEAQPMTTADLRAWQARMGYTQQAAADALGVSLATFKRWLTGGDVPRLVALACAALRT